METPTTPSQANLEPSEMALRFLAAEMESFNFATGGRIITPPSKQELTSVTNEGIARARQYYFEHMNGQPLFEPPLP